MSSRTRGHAGIHKIKCAGAGGVLSSASAVAPDGKDKDDIPIPTPHHAHGLAGLGPSEEHVQLEGLADA